MPDYRLALTELDRLVLEFFRNKKELVFVIDDTLIHKIYSRYMRGSGYFYDTHLGKRVLAFKLLLSGVTDGKYFISFMGSFLFSKEVCSNHNPSKDTLVKHMILTTV